MRSGQAHPVPRARLRVRLTLPGVLFMLVCLLAGAWSLSSCAAEAQEPPADSLDPEIVRALELASRLQQRQGGGSGDLATPAAILLSVLSALAGLWKIAPQVGRDPEVAAGIARIEARQQADHEELGRVREKLHELNNTLTPLPGQLEDLCERIESLEGEPPRSRT